MNTEKEYRAALRQIMTHISYHWGETFPGDDDGIDAIIDVYVKLGWFDEETNPLPGFTLENPELSNFDSPTEEEVRIGPILQPIPITGPGWYRTKEGSRAYVRYKDPEENTWIGSVRVGEMSYYNEWLENGTDKDDFENWMIVTRIDE